MSPCRNCGKINTPEAIFCRSCGTKLASGQVQPQTFSPDPYELPSPRPYSWKTDEFGTQSEARRTMPIAEVSGHAPLQHAQPHGFASAFRCPNCMTHMPPRIERKVSTAGWVTFAILMVTVFPLFWIGLLIKEDVPICQICQTRLALGPYR
ncbi:MAG TPA: LITAF-like zinc ribbon domain-containing protein [Pyrinomonadaceae bacterium]|nr:LITAF-like zinc ribbon domain-containing protein [Pyrinomonadaceae bacterium]